MITTPHSYIHCPSVGGQGGPPTGVAVDSSGCWTEPGPLSLALEVVSQSPRVFVIQDLLSEAECDHVVEQGKKSISRSVVAGGHESHTRTSSTGWLQRRSTPVMERLFERFADILGVSSEELDTSKRAESLQVVRYEQGQEYMVHHDFWDEGRPEARVLTLLLHVQPAEEGGATNFPKAAEGQGLAIKPPKGSAVLFYSMMPDGNSDDASLHAGAPVVKGVKWACNLWVWDPKFMHTTA